MPEPLPGPDLDYPRTQVLRIDFVRGEPSVLVLAGEIDMSSAGRLSAALDEASSTDPMVVVDLAGVTFIDACGLHALIAAAESLDGSARLRLTNARRVAWLLRLVGLSDVPSLDVRESGDRHGR